MSCKKVYASFSGHDLFLCLQINVLALTRTDETEIVLMQIGRRSEMVEVVLSVNHAFISTGSSHEPPPAANESDVVLASVSCDAELSKYLYESGLASILLPFLFLHLFELRSYCSHIYIVFKELQTYDKL